MNETIQQKVTPSCVSAPAPRKVYVIGHKNPDTDSICSAIAYADIKRRTEEGIFEAKRAGQISQETQYVLDRFQVDPPGYVPNVAPRVKDMEVRRIPGVSDHISLKKAWNLMRTQNVNTLPIVQEGNTLEGLITISDIAKSYMDVYDNAILSTARTQYKNILETLDGTMVVGNEHAYFVKGKVVIAAANPDLMENYIEEDDLVILGNRYESQLCAIEMKAGCIIVCEGAPVSKTIQRLAADRVCAVISTPHDTYTVARLINQSMPVQFFMTGENLVTFQMGDAVEDIENIMKTNRFHNFPVVEKCGNYVGLISRRRLLNMNRKKVILVDHNEISQAVDGIQKADILEIVDHHRLGGFETLEPVFFRNQPVGCTATIITQLYDEKGVVPDRKIAGLLASAIISDTLMFRSPTCTALDRATCERLADMAGINITEMANNMFQAASSLQGKTPEEICYQDFKIFNNEGRSFGVSQVTSMDSRELDSIREKVEEYLPQVMEQQDLDMMFMMMTNIVDTSTELLCCGLHADLLAKEAFDIADGDEHIILKDIVSRKKQFLPAFVEALHQ